MLVDAAKHGDVEIPVFCYEPKLGAPVGACRMCLVEIEGIPKLQTGCSTPVKDGMVVHTQTDRVQARAGGGRRVPARQPPARLPGLRQGRRVPAAGHLVRLGRRALALHRAQAPLREAARAVAADRDRPRALHPLLPLRALQPGDLRGLPAGPRRSAAPHTYVATFDGHPYVAPFSGNIIELCPVGALTSQPYRFRARPWDIEGAGSVCTLCPCAVQRRPSPSATSASCACSAATTPRSTTAGCATRAASPTRRSTSTSASPQPMVRDGGELRAGLVGARARRGRRGRCSAPAGRVGALVGGETTNEEGFLLAAPDARGARARATSTRARRRAAAARRCSARSARPALAGDRPRPRVRPHRARARLRAGRRHADRRPAHPQGRAPPRRASSRVATSRPSSLDPNARAVGALRARRRRAFAPPLDAALGAPATRDEVGRRAARRGREAGAVLALADCCATPASDVVILCGERLSRRRAGHAARALLDVAGASGSTRPRRRRPARACPAAHERPRPARGRRAAQRRPRAGRRRRARGRDAREMARARRDGELTALYLLHTDPVARPPGRRAWGAALERATTVVAHAELPHRGHPRARRPSSSRPSPTPRRRAPSPTPTAASSACAAAIGHPGETRRVVGARRARAPARASTLGVRAGPMACRQLVRRPCRSTPGIDARRDRRQGRALAGARRGLRPSPDVDRSDRRARAAARRAPSPTGACAWARSARCGRAPEVARLARAALPAPAPARWSSRPPTPSASASSRATASSSARTATTVDARPSRVRAADAARGRRATRSRGPAPRSTARSWRCARHDPALAARRRHLLSSRGGCRSSRRS